MLVGNIAGSDTSNQSPIGGDESLLALKRSLSPDDFAAAMRAKGDVFYWEPGKFWVVTRHRLATLALRRSELSADRRSFFVSRMPRLDLRLIKDFFSVVEQMMVMSDDRRHLDRRKIVTDAFAGMDEGFLPTLVATTMDEVLAGIAGQSRFEFVTQVAKLVPVHFLAELFGIPANFRHEFFACSSNMTQFFGGASQYLDEDGIRVNASAKTLRDYFRSVVQDRRAADANDFIWRVVTNGRDIGMATDEIVSQLIMVLVAGQVTTTDQIANNMYTLLSHPAEHQRLRLNPELIPLAVEELNRWDPGVTFLFRVARARLDIGRAQIHPGDVVFFANHAINRDEEVFSSPGKLDLGRLRNPHFAFGSHAHYCIGAPIARMMMSALLTRWLQQLPPMELDPAAPAVRLHYSLAFSGFQSIWCVLENRSVFA
jgi:cytochrome P450 PksS